MTKSVWVILAQEGMPRTNVTSNTQNWGPNMLSAIRKDVPESSTVIDEHCRNKVQGRVLKYLRRKLLPPY